MCRPFKKDRVGALFVLALAAGLLAGRGAGAQVLIADDEVWKFFRGTAAPSDPPAAWRAVDFDDAAWEEGQTGIGYGDNDDATTITGMQGSYVALFARKSFTVADPAAVTALSLVIDYDDGFAAYLNNTEVARRAMGAAGQEFALNQVATALHEAGTEERIDLSAQTGLLLAGENVLAVEVRNQSLDSTDLSFKPSLIANDPTLTCPTGLTCAFANGAVVLSWTNNRPAYDRIEITRDGIPIAGSPFAGDAASAQDAAPGTLDADYQLTAFQEGAGCPVLACTSTVQSRGLGTLQCALAQVGGATQATLTWTDIPGTQSVEIRREGAVIATVGGGVQLYVDSDVESDMPEDDTNFEILLTDAAGGTATMTCGADLSLCPTLTCAAADVAGVSRARLTIGNLVKEWTGFTLQRTAGGQTVEVANNLPPATTEFTDESIALEGGVVYTYTLQPIAPAGEQVACDRTCSLSPPAPEIASYDPPAGGWDYSLDFEAAPGTPLTLYNPVAGEAGNLDGRWIRSVDRDFWDGSAPDVVGQPPDGDAPGGIEVVSRPGLGPCGTDIKALRLLDPGDPSAPAGSLAAAYPDPFTDPSNKAIFLGLDTEVIDRNLLREGVTLAARWRVDPNAPAYLAATAAGDGEPLVGGALGNIGFHFRNDLGALAAEGPGVSCSFNLNSGDELQFSADDDVGGPFELPVAGISTFRSLWVTVQDPEGDGTYDVTTYNNGRTTPFAFGTGTFPLEDEVFDFGAAVGNYLTIGLPDVANDGVIEIDFIGYKAGVHAPASTECSPCANNPPNARIVVTPPGGQVTLAGGRAQATLDGSSSDNGDGGAAGLAFSWSKVSGPVGDAIAAPGAASTTVGFTQAGTYVYRLTVGDGQSCRNLASAQTAITVLPEVGGRPTFRRGDLNADGKLDVTDPVNLLGFLFLGQAKPACHDAADTDDDGKADISDAVSSLGYQFLGQRAPADPGPANCGPDAAAEVPDLGCDAACR